MNINRRTAATGFVLLSMVGGAWAEEPTRGVGTLEEVIVTATRRPTSLQDVSVSVTAVDGETVRALGIENGQQVAELVPNFTVQSTFGPASPPYMNIRGVSYIDFDFVNEMSIGTYVDEVYQGHQGSVSGQLFDLERVEVLRGPQGTLFGRNTTGGLVHFVSRKPGDELDGYFSIQAGSFDQVIAEGAIGGPLADGVRGRIAAKYNVDDGIRDNQGVAGSRFGKTDVTALRGTLQFDLAETLTAEASVHYSKSDSTFAGYAFYGNLDPVTFTQCPVDAVLNSRCVNEAGFRDPDPSSSHTNSRHRSLPNQAENIGGYIRIDWDREWGRLTSISAYEDVETYIVQDITATATANAFIDTEFDSDMHQFSQEFRAEGSAQRVDWLLGAYYYEDVRKARVDTYVNDFLALPSSKEVDTRSYALFGEVGMAVTDTVKLVGGLRFTDEERDLENFKTRVVYAPPPIGLSDSVLTGRGAIEWRPVDAAMLYLQYSRGFKSGGFNTSATVRNPAQIGPVDPEEVDAYEIGVKSQWFDNHLRANMSAFYMDYQGMQASSGQIDETGAIIIKFLNIGDARIYGSEIELFYVPTNAWEFTLGVGLLDTKISAPQTILIDGRSIDGKELASAPAYNVNGVVRYRRDLDRFGSLTLLTSFRYQDDVYFGPDNNPYELQDGYGVLNLRIGWTDQDERFDVQLFVENATDEDYATHAFQSKGFPVSYRALGTPRRYGVRFGVSF